MKEIQQKLRICNSQECIFKMTTDGISFWAMDSSLILTRVKVQDTILILQMTRSSERLRFGTLVIMSHINCLVWDSSTKTTSKCFQSVLNKGTRKTFFLKKKSESSAWQESQELRTVIQEWLAIFSSWFTKWIDYNPECINSPRHLVSLRSIESMYNHFELKTARLSRKDRAVTTACLRL